MTKKKTAPLVHDHLGFRVLEYSIRINAGLNHEIFDSLYSYPKCPVYMAYSSLELTGLCCYPEEREGANYKFTLMGKEGPGESFNAVLEDFHVLGKHDEPKYRKRGKYTIPVYDPPISIGFIDSGRKDKPWHAYAWVPPGSITDMYVALSSSQPLFIAMHEVKAKKYRHIRSITLQSVNPAED